MAGHARAAVDLRELRLGDRADLLRLGAAGVEAAGARRVGGTRNVATEHPALLPVAGGIRLRHRRQQRPRVWVTGKAVQIVARADLDDLAEVHDGDAIAHVPDDRQVVGDQHDRQAEATLQVAQQVQHLCLDRDVERRHRLIGDQELRLKRDRARHADALALAAGELVRVAVVVLGVQPDRLHQPLHLALSLAPCPGRRLVDRERLADDRADRLARVQRGVRVLEDQLNLAADGLQFEPPFEARDVLALEADLPGGRRPAGA